jgi:uncharacterized protein YegP (UPF0339 family)
MDAQFQLYIDTQATYRFQLIGADGTALLTSAAYAQKSAAIAGIAAVRDAAAAGSVVDGTQAHWPSEQ